jgi:endonuclease/exonuclease/phosphatase family metal-dependent hydrolase
MRPSLRVLTLNLWNRSEPFAERMAAVRKGLTELQPDVVGLQEVILADDLDQATLVAEGFGYHKAFGAADRTLGNALLSRWPILHHETFALPRGGTNEGRSLLYARVDSPHGKIPFFVTHLNWRLNEGHVRELQVREVTDRIADLAPVHGFPPILMGDFNAEPESDEMRFLRGLTSLHGRSVYFADAFLNAGQAGQGRTFCRRNPFAAPLLEPDRRIDYVYVRGPDERGRGEPLEAEVCLDLPYDGVFASDHFGVLATVSAG